MSDEQLIFCNWCNQPSVVVWVHGHGQCSVCRTTIDECCRGEVHPPIPSQLDRRSFNEVGKEEEKEKTEND